MTDPPAAAEDDSSPRLHRRNASPEPVSTDRARPLLRLGAVQLEPERIRRTLHDFPHYSLHQLKEHGNGKTEGYRARHHREVRSVFLGG